MASQAKLAESVYFYRPSSTEALFIQSGSVFVIGGTLQICSRSTALKDEAQPSSYKVGGKTSTRNLCEYLYDGMAGDDFDVEHDDVLVSKDVFASFLADRRRRLPSRRNWYEQLHVLPVPLLGPRGKLIDARTSTQVL